MRCVEHLAKKDRRIHELQARRILQCPATHQQKRSQSASIQLLNVGKIEHKHTETLELFDPAPELIEGNSAHHAPGAAYDGYILQAFDLELKIHTSIHTNQPWKKFRGADFSIDVGTGQRSPFCGQICLSLKYFGQMLKEREFCHDLPTNDLPQRQVRMDAIVRE